VSPFDREVLAERTMAVDRHLRRVAERLPASANDLQPATDASDAVILHLWQATQIVIDLATAAARRSLPHARARHIELDIGVVGATVSGA
jgi:hypothetical protein